MINDKCYLFNPFKIQQASEEQIINTYATLQNDLVENAETPLDLSNNIIRYSDMNYLIGEIIARYKEQYNLLKTRTQIEKSKYLYTSRKQWQETQGKPPAMDYFEAMATEYVEKNLNELATMESKIIRFKNAFDSISEKQNALKKKLEAIKYEM